MASEERFRYLIENSHDGILLLSAEGAILYRSPSMENLIGYRTEERLGEDGLGLIHPEDLPRARMLFDALLKTPGARGSAELRVRHKDGSWRVLEVASANRLDTPSVGGVVVNVRDVTERVLAAQQLSYQKAVLEAQSQASPNGIAVADVDGRCLVLNRRFVELWRVSETILEDPSCEQLLDIMREQVVESEAFVARVHYLHEHPEVTHRETLTLEHGQTLDYYTAPVHRPEGGYYGRVWFFRDITEQMAHERRQASLLRVARTFAATGDMDKLLTVVLAEAMALVGGEAGLLSRWDEQQSSLVTVRETGLIGDDATVVGRAARDRALAHDAPAIVDLDPAPSERGTMPVARTAIVAPLRYEGRLVGALMVTATEPGRRFTTDDLSSLEMLAATAAAALVGQERARLEGVLLAVRTAQHHLNNQLSLTVGYAELLAENPRLDPAVRRQAQETLRGALEASATLQQLQRITRLKEVDLGAPSGPLLDLERSAPETAS
jgi:PAS domain S-box-containing protein